ncbi:hypothetical protein KKH56_01110 [bacterium]|nr:hypothetical protein [bacterium]
MRLSGRAQRLRASWNELISLVGIFSSKANLGNNDELFFIVDVINDTVSPDPNAISSLV